MHTYAHTYIHTNIHVYIRIHAYVFTIYSLGRDPVIKGLEEGLLGMQEGGKRRWLIPSALGYQNQQQVPIPRSFGNRQRLYSTVLTTERTVREREALGADIAGVYNS